MGWMYRGLCHDRQQDAIDNYYQNLPFVVLPTITNSIFIYYNKNSTGTWSLVKQTVSNTGATTTNHNFVLAPPNFATCTENVSTTFDSLTSAQGALIGVSILLIWAVAWAFRAIIFSLKSNESTQNET